MPSFRSAIGVLFNLSFDISVLVLGFTFLYFCQLFQRNVEGLPQVHYYRWRSIPFHDKALTFFSYVSNDAAVGHVPFQAIRAKARGGANADFPKHNFAFELADNHPLGGMESDDDWILSASFLDKSFMRHKMSFELFQAFNEAHCVPNCRFVEVYRNFQYRGVYVLMERMDRKRLGVKKGDTAACIFKEPGVFIHPETWIPQGAGGTLDHYHQKYPKVEERSKSMEVHHLRNFIASSSDSLFNDPFRGIRSFFDLNELIDWHLLLLTTHNTDAVIKGFYLYRENYKSPYRLALWDYDNTFGRDTDNEKHDPGMISLERNTLLSRLEELNTGGYRQKLYRRYRALVDQGILTSDYLLALLEKNRSQVEPFVDRNEVRWPVDAEPFYDSADFQDEMTYMKSWILKQMKLLEAYMDQHAQVDENIP